MKERLIRDEIERGIKSFEEEIARLPAPSQTAALPSASAGAIQPPKPANVK